jgi:hypothetical protein
VAFFGKVLPTGDTALTLSTIDNDPRPPLPGVLLWAWERPERLTFIDTNQVGVAYLALTVRLKEREVVLKPRVQPLEIPSGTSIVAVARIETDRRRPPGLSLEQRLEAVSAVARLAHSSHVRAIQIDFDARESERGFYRELLVELRQHLSPSMKLSITALASWCIYDRWIEGLPIDEAVPMLFRMGPDKETVERRLKSKEDFVAEASRHSVGISTDEPIEHLPVGRRLYVFNPSPWTEDSVRAILEKVKESR